MLFLLIQALLSANILFTSGWSSTIITANSDAFKVAVNRLCNIADDVYRKQIPDLTLSEEQKGAINGLLVRLDDLTKDKVKEGMKDLSVNSTNYNATIRKLEQMQGDK